MREVRIRWWMSAPAVIAMLGCMSGYVERQNAYKRELDALTYELPCNQVLEVANEVLQDRGTTVNYTNPMTLETPMFDTNAAMGDANDLVILAKFKVFARAPTPNQCQLVAERHQQNMTPERAVDVELETLKRLDPDRHAAILQVAERAANGGS